MPWHKKAMKDVVSCDKPRGDANNLRSEDLRMGKPFRRHGRKSPAEYIGRVRQTEGTETSKYLLEKKTTVILQVAASERGLAQTDLMLKPACVVRSGLRESVGR